MNTLKTTTVFSFSDLSSSVKIINAQIRSSRQKRTILPRSIVSGDPLDGSKKRAYMTIREREPYTKLLRRINGTCPTLSFKSDNLAILVCNEVGFAIVCLL